MAGERLTVEELEQHLVEFIHRHFITLSASLRYTARGHWTVTEQVLNINKLFTSQENFLFSPHILAASCSCLQKTEYHKMYHEQSNFSTFYSKVHRF